MAAFRSSHCALSNSRVDKLGDALREHDPKLDQLRDLDVFRRSYSDAYQLVIGRLAQILRLQPTGRPYKSTLSIVEKLRREKVRLSQMQDIAGCRIIIQHAFEQDRIVDRIRMVLGEVLIDDRRKNPSNGYRAVHIVCSVYGRPIEIQVRTTLQHLWAELSEKLSDKFDRTIKYGGGPEEIRAFLNQLRKLVASVENYEISKLKQASTRPELMSTKRTRKQLKKGIEENDRTKRKVQDLLREIQKSLTDYEVKS